MTEYLEIQPDLFRGSLARSEEFRGVFSSSIFCWKIHPENLNDVSILKNTM